MTDGSADLADVRTRIAGSKIGAKMKLRADKSEGEQKNGQAENGTVTAHRCCNWVEQECRKKTYLL